MEQIDILILGAGPAGLTAALYAARSKYTVLVIEEYMIGGQCVSIDTIENFPSYKSISGMELTTKMYEQCVSLGVRFKISSVSSVDTLSKIVTTKDNEYHYNKLIIATGLTYNKPDVDRIDDYVGRGVSYCTVCDANLYKGKTVAVLSNSNIGTKDSEYLSHYADTVYHINSNAIKSATSSDKIINLPHSHILSLQGGLSVNEITVTDNNNNIQTFKINGLFVAMGKTPSSKLFDNVKKDAHGYIITDDNMETNIDSVYAVGDIRSKTLRQVVTACSDGAIAATDAIKKLNKSI